MGEPLLAPLEQIPDSAGKSRLFAEVMDKYETGVKRRAPAERDWYLAREFFKGNQYAVWIDGRGIVQPQPSVRKKPKLVWNKIRVSVETILSYLLKSDPTFSVTPNTGDYEDIAAALTSRRVLYSYFYLLELAEKIERTGLWTCNTGAGFFKVGWNPLAGPKLPIMGQVPIPPLPGMENILQMAPQFKEVQVGETPGGDVRVDVVSPFEFIPDDGAETIEQCQWAIHATMVPVDELKRLYKDNPKAQDFIKADTGAAEGTGFMSRALQSFGLGQPNYQKGSAAKRCLMIEYWSRPVGEFEGGLRVVSTKYGTLEATAVPPGYDHIPFAMWGDRYIPGEFWPHGTTRDALPLQKQLNKRFSQAADIADRFKMKWVAQDGSIDETKLNDVDGEVVTYTGRPPDTKSPPPLPDTVVKLIEMCGGAIDDVTAAVAVLQGKSDQGGEERSGRQVAYKGQYGETRIARLAKHLARFLSRTGRLILMQVAANCTDERVGRMAGKNRQIEVFYFKGADLRDNTDVTVEAGSLLGFTNEQRFEKLMRMYDAKVIGADKVLDSMEIEDFYPLVEAQAQDRNGALRENETWRQGQTVQAPLYFEEHRTHLIVHNSYRKSTEYQRLDDMQRALVDAHCGEHEKMLVAQLQISGGNPALPPIGPASVPPPAMGPGTPPNGGAPGGGAPPPGDGAGAPPTPANIRESGPEIAAGLPTVPAVPEVAPEQPHGI